MLARFCACVWPANAQTFHLQIFWDPAQKGKHSGAGRYVATTRDVHPPSCDQQWSGKCQRDIGMTTSLPGRGFAFEGTAAPTLVEAGEVAHQLYAQVTWRWHSVYLGIVMVRHPLLVNSIWL